MILHPNRQEPLSGNNIKKATMINHHKKSLSNFKIKICVEL